MRTVQLFQLLQRKVLVTRESAGVLQDAIRSVISENGELTLDFEGVDAITPSFIDELMGLIEDAKQLAPTGGIHVLFSHTPTPLSEKFLAIGRRHKIEISQAGSDSWEMSSSLSESA